MSTRALHRLRDYRATLRVMTAVVVLTVPLGPVPAAELDAEAAKLIQQAGNADEDAVRLDYLRQLQARPELDAALKADVGKLVRQIERWLQGSPLSYFGREVSQKKDFDFGIDAGSPVYPLTYLYRGRMVAWWTMESGSIWTDPARRRKCLDTARGFFERAAAAFPGNRIARMYLGEAIGVRKAYAEVRGAPPWAVYQREGLERLADVIEWWIDHRMRENGEYGGGWGDDCEMWRWWVPVLIGFEDPKIGAAQARFSEALMRQPHMAGGYTSRMSDVEHTAEDSADAITPMMHLEPENPAWSRWALRLAELMETRWTGRNERGLLQFKSTHFTADEVDGRPEGACDTVYHPRVVQPALLYWQRTGDEKLGRLFRAWMDTWVDAAARSERGKPAGVLPSAIHWPDGRPGGLGPDWWDPRNHGESTLYLWPSSMGLMTHTLLLAHHMTGEAKYLEPIRAMAAIRLRYLDGPREAAPAAGSEAWCAARAGGLADVIAKYRLLTGSVEFARLLEADASPFVAFRLGGDRGAVEAALRRNAEALRFNFEGYTSEVRYTDRVLRFPALYGENGMHPEAIGKVGQPEISSLYSTVTGDPGDAGYFPLNAVRWLTPPRDIAALVTASGRDGFAAELFHFGERERPMSAELYLLAPGAYTFSLTATGGGKAQPSATQDLVVKGPRTRVSFVLPPRELCVLKVDRLPRELDAAAGPRAPTAKGRTNVRVALYDAAGAFGDGLAELRKLLGHDRGLEVQPVGPEGIRAGVLEQFEVVVFPGGSGSGQAEALGDDGRRRVRGFVEGGGGFVGVCAGAYLASAQYDWSLAVANAGVLSGSFEVPGEGTKEMWLRGGGDVDLEFTETGRRILGASSGMQKVRYVNGPILLPGDRADLHAYVPLAYFRSEISMYKPQEGTMVGTPAIVSARFGKGRVLVLSPHLELSKELAPCLARGVAWSAGKSSATGPTDRGDQR